MSEAWKQINRKYPKWKRERKKGENKKPLTEHEEQVEQHQKQYTCNWSPRRSRKYYAEETTETIVNN